MNYSEKNMNDNAERKTAQAGETYFMPMHTEYCRIDTHDKESKKTLIKWLDEHDKYNKPHKVFRVRGNFLYITGIGEVTEGDYLYTDPIARCGIKTGSWKLFPRQIVDEIDSDCVWRYAGEEWRAVVKKVSDKIEADTKIEEEYLEKKRKGWTV